MAEVLIIDGDRIMQACLAQAARSAGAKVAVCTDVFAALAHIDHSLPALIIMEVLLPGPDGFTLLHELASYPDTARIPILIVTEASLPRSGLSAYGVIDVLDKATLTPAAIKDYIHLIPSPK